MSSNDTYYAMTESEFNNLANAIKTKAGISGTMLGSEMTTKVNSMTTLAQALVTGGAITIDFDVPDYAFYHNTKITSVTFGPNCTSIGREAFASSSVLTSVIIGDNVASIDYGAFGYCSYLTSVVIGSGVTNMGNSAFAFCSNLTSVTLKNGITKIGDYGFDNCSKLTSITIPSSVTNIGSYAFRSCSSLTKTNYTGTLSQWLQINIGNYDGLPMRYSKNLYINDVLVTNCVIENGVTSIPANAFYCCESITSITIPSSVTSIGARAFASCTGLTNIVIPNSIITISDYAFSGCKNITTVSIGLGLASLPAYLFCDCSNLATLNLYGASLVSIQSNTFSGCTKINNAGSASINVPSALLSSYQSASYWSTSGRVSNLTAFSAVSMTIGGTAYNTTGEYWDDWCDSSYNTDGYVVSGHNILNSAKTHYVALNGTAVNAQTDIATYEAYTLVAI